VATLVVALALWIHAGAGPSAMVTGARPGVDEPAPTATGGVLEGHGRQSARARSAQDSAASDGPRVEAWEVVPESPAGDRLTLELPAPDLGSDPGSSLMTLSAWSDSGEWRWIGLLPEEREPPQYYFCSPPSGVVPLAEIAEGGALGVDGSWIVRTSLTHGRWLVRLSSRGFGGAASETLAWGCVEAGTKEGRARLQRTDPDRVGRLRLWARAEGQRTVTVRWRDFIWATSHVDEDAEEWVVPADEDLHVSLTGWDPNGWPLDVPSRTVRVAPRGVVSAGFDVPPMSTVRFTARPPGTASDPVDISVRRMDPDGDAVPQGGPREVGPDTYEMHLPAGTYVAVVTGPALAGSARTTFRVEPPGPVFVDFDWSDAGMAFRLRLREADGTAADDLRVVLRRTWTRDPAPPVEAHVSSDAEGTLTLGPVEAGPLELHVESRGLFRTIDVPAEAGRTLDLVLPPASASARNHVTVRVEEADGTPWPSGSATLGRRDEDWVHYTLGTGWRGEGYTFTHVPAGDYVLTLPPTTHRDGVAIPVTVAAGEDRRLVVRPRSK
jgi:hypothetical protein